MKKEPGFPTGGRGLVVDRVNEIGALDRHRLDCARTSFVEYQANLTTLPGDPEVQNVSVRTIALRASVLGVAALIVVASGIACARSGHLVRFTAPESAARESCLSRDLAWVGMTGGVLGHDEAVDDLDEDDQRRSLKFVRAPLECSLRDGCGLLSSSLSRHTLNPIPAGRFRLGLRC